MNQIFLTSHHEGIRSIVNVNGSYVFLYRDRYIREYYSEGLPGDDSDPLVGLVKANGNVAWGKYVQQEADKTNVLFEVGGAVTAGRFNLALLSPGTCTQADRVLRYKDITGKYVWSRIARGTPRSRHRARVSFGPKYGVRLNRYTPEKQFTRDCFVNFAVDIPGETIRQTYLTYDDKLYVMFNRDYRDGSPIKLSFMKFDTETTTAHAFKNVPNVLPVFPANRTVFDFAVSGLVMAVGVYTWANNTTRAVKDPEVCLFDISDLSKIKLKATYAVPGEFLSFSSDGLTLAAYGYDPVTSKKVLSVFDMD